MNISIIIPTYNASQKFRTLLGKIKIQTISINEIIVIDSSSQDNTVEIAREFEANVTVIPKNEFNHGGTRNRASIEAKGDILVFMTQDAIPVDERCIENLVQPLNNPDIAASYGRQISNPDATPIEKYARLFNYPDKSFIKNRSDIKELGIKTYFFPSVFSAVKKNIFEEVNRFPDHIIMNEDIVLAAKLIDNEYKIAYAADAVVYHSHNYSLFEQFKRYFDIGVALNSQQWILDIVKAEVEGRKYLRSELNYLLKEKQWKWIPYMYFEALTKLTGYRLGLLEKRIPVHIKRVLSMHSFYWNGNNEKPVELIEAKKEGSDTQPGKIDKRILFLSPFFYPEMISTGKYNSYLVKALINSGYSLDVVASHPLYPDWKPKTSEADLQGSTIHRGGAWMRYPKSTVMRRILFEFWFVSHAAIRTRQIGKTVDMVIAVFPPNLYMLLVKRFVPSNIRTVGIVHDLQAIMARTQNTFFRRIIASIVQHVELRALDNCDELICMSEKMRDAIVETYGISQNKCKVHYPFITENSDLGHTSELSGIMPDGFIHIVYSGALGEKQKPEFLIGFFTKMCLKRDDVMCHIFSRGPLFDHIKNKLGMQHAQRIGLHDLVPENMLGELYERSSVQIIPQAEGTGAGAFPSKVPNLLNAGVPIFAICDLNSELAEVLNETGIGKAVHTWNIELCVEEMNQFLESIQDESHDERFKKVKAYIDMKFNVEQVVDTIIGDVGQ